MERYFSAGEFAKLTRVKKDTIFYYDKIGLLKPDFVNEKGYRYYSNKKYWQMLQVKALRDSGCSLEEIKNCQCDAKEIYHHPQKRIEELRCQIAALEFALQCQKTYLGIYEYLEKNNYEQFILRDREEEFFLCTPICWDDEEDDAFVNLILEYNKHLDHFQKLNLPYSYLEGICTFFSDCDELKNPPLLITKVFQRGDGDDFLTKPGGRYLSLIHKGRWQDERQDYQVIE